MKQQILSLLPAECPTRDTLYWFDSTDSTNNQAKLLASAGAPAGTAVIADCQTSGRGRMGRSFVSDAGAGVYLSFILRPACSAAECMHLTCAVAVAACDAIESVCAVRPKIKWINDLILGNKKLGGILTELSLIPGTDRIDYAVVGIGINCNQQQEDFPDGLQNIATSLRAKTGKTFSRAALCASLIEKLSSLQENLICKEDYLEAYRRDCITLGKQVVLLPDEVSATALAVDEEGALSVRLADGTVRRVISGEASVRGIGGYL